MSTKIEHAIYQMTRHPFTFQKYKGMLIKEVDNLKHMTRYKVISIEGYDEQGEPFKILCDIIETDLNLVNKEKN